MVKKSSRAIWKVLEGRQCNIHVPFNRSGTDDGHSYQQLVSKIIPRLYKKIKDNLLPRPADIKQFYEILTELQVVFKLVTHASPLILEPPIPGQRRVPDIAFQLPDGIVYFDVTVFRGGPLERWEDAKEQIREALGRRVINRKKALNVDIQIPFENIKTDQIIKQALDGMNKSDTGKVSVGSKGMIGWEPFPIIEVENESSIPEISTFAAAYHTSGATADIAFGSQASIAAPLPEDLQKVNELLFKSVCNKLKEKHDQFPRNQPSLYVIKLGHWVLSTASLLKTI